MKRNICILTILSLAIWGAASAVAQSHRAPAMASQGHAFSASAPSARIAPSSGGGNHWTGSNVASHNWSGNHWSGHHWDGRRHYHHHSNFFFGVGLGYPYGFGYPYGYGYPYYPYDYGYYAQPVVYEGASRGTGSVVAVVQQRLARAGYYHGAIDGVAGHQTRRAIRAYERSRGLSVDGQIDGELLGAMGIG